MRLLMLSIAVVGKAAKAPYPHSTLPTSTLLVYSELFLSAPEDLVTLETLGGGLARMQPQFYRVPTFPNATDSYALWLAEMTAHFDVTANLEFLQNPLGLVDVFVANITGFVLFNLTDNSLNAALTFIAGQGSGDLLVAAGSVDVLQLLGSHNVPMVFDARGHTELDAYLMRGALAYNGHVVSFQLESQFTNLVEYAVFARAPTIEYECTNAADQNKCFAANGTQGGPAAIQVVADMAKLPGPKVAMGWGPESAYVATLGAAGVYVHASDDAHNVAPIANVAAYAARDKDPSGAYLSTPRTQLPTKHHIAFLMSDGDNIQWLYNNFATDPNSWWGSPDRGKVALGWTLSPGLVELGPVVLSYLARTKSANDDFVGAPSGIGYTYPSVWAAASMADFANLTAAFMTRTQRATGAVYSAVNVIGDPCVGGVYKPNCQGLVTPNLSSLDALLTQPEIDGIFWYTFGAGYSGWSDTLWLNNKPIIGGRVSLWGEATTGTMLGVAALVQRFEALLQSGDISTDGTQANGYSLVPVHAWSHNVTDVLTAATLLQATGLFDVITPSALLSAVAANVVRGFSD